MKHYTSKLKRSIQSYMWSGTGMKGSAVALCGPNPEHVYKDFLNIRTPLSKLHLYDLEKDCIKKANTLTDPKVRTYCKNIAGLERPQRFMDMDFTASLLSTEYLIKYLFDMQRRMTGNIDKYKVFIYTVSTRPSKNIDLHSRRVLSDLVKMTKLKLKYHTYEQNNMGEHSIAYGDNIKAERIWYSDTSPMITHRIIYKLR